MAHTTISEIDGMKRFIDIIVAGSLIVLLSPLLVSVALAVRVTSPGPVLFVQERIGLNGKVFRMFKFRTMFQNTEKTGTGLYSFDNDPRITRIGRILRGKSLDELPQLFNVLGGSMSLVGPRPPVTYELGPWEDYTSEMRKRFELKPGITGLAQISGRNELDWDEKIVFDNLYVDHFRKIGFWVDLIILWRTLWVVISGHDTVERDLSSKERDGPLASRARKAGLFGSRKEE
jgi:lipopolysaccharide/colanic/teichoic acid biosynthesis glycosyltransferase